MMDPVSGYEDLYYVLEEAFKQATEGKGAERHARGNPFHEQHMQKISTLLGSHDGMAFQAIKKLTEGLAFTDPDRRDRELLGVIVYVAGIIVWHREREVRPSGPAVVPPSPWKSCDLCGSVAGHGDMPCPFAPPPPPPPPSAPTTFPLCKDCLEYHSAAVSCAPVALARRGAPKQPKLTSCGDCLHAPCICSPKHDPHGRT